MRHCDDLGFIPARCFCEPAGASAAGPAWTLPRLRRTRRRADRRATAWPTYCRRAVAVQRACLLPGQSLTQRFDVARDATLCRIDVQISRCRGRRTLDRVAWNLYAVGPSDSRRLIAHDTIDMGRVGRDEFVTLNDPAIECRRLLPSPSGRGAEIGTPLNWFFSPPNECPSDEGVELPLYSCDGGSETAFDTDALPLPTNATLSLKGFLFLKRPEMSLASVASKSSPNR